MTPELTLDYHERTQLNMYRFSFSIFGSLLAVTLHPLLVGLGGKDVQRGYLISAGVVGSFMILTVLAAFRWTHERPPAAPEDATAMVQQIRQCLHNRPFLLVTGIFFFSWLCLALVQNNLLLYARYAADVEYSLP